MTCHDTERLLELRAAELLPEANSDSLSAHLLVCPTCEAKAQRIDGLFEAARLPPLSAAEERRVADLRHFLPPLKRAPPTLRWAGMAAALAASALLGLQLGNAGAPAPRAIQPSTVQRAAVRTPSATSMASASVDNFDDAADALDSFDTDTDSALYDAVVFQGGVMPFDLDNG
jgi:hypothetical protein